VTFVTKCDQISFAHPAQYSEARTKQTWGVADVDSYARMCVCVCVCVCLCVCLCVCMRVNGSV